MLKTSFVPEYGQLMTTPPKLETESHEPSTKINAGGFCPDREGATQYYQLHQRIYAERLDEGKR